MSIKPINEMPIRKLEIDLTGSDGNAFVLLAYADKLGRKLGMSPEEIKKIKNDMKSKDYEHLIKVFDLHFGKYVNLYK